MAFLTIEVPRRHARTRAIIRDTVLPANLTNEGRKDGPRGVARVVSDVSVLCPPSDVELDNEASNAADVVCRRIERASPVSVRKGPGCCTSAASGST